MSEETATGTRVSEVGVGPLAEGSVLVRVAYSSLNYKDALAVTGRGRVLRRLPLTPGIDLAGFVERSRDERFTRGDRVIANGMGLGELRDGGFAELVEVPADWLVPLPAGLTLLEAMALGTAGFTAGLAVHRMEANGQTPAHGAIVVTGATGGVGSIAVSILAGLGYQVTAVSGRPDHEAWLRSLGATDVVTPDRLELGNKPLDKARFGGAVDNVGGELLGSLLPHIIEWGNVVAVGLAGGTEFRTTVLPFILRGVSLLGASSANCPMPLRTAIWRRLGSDLKPPALDMFVTRVITLDEIVATAHALLNRELHGRVVVAIGVDPQPEALAE